MCAEGRGALEAKIRLAQALDLRAVFEILAQSPEAASWSSAGLQSVFEQNADYFLVASEGFEILGFVAGRALIDEAEILNLAVAPAYRRAGLGKALVQSLLRSFATEDVATVFLEVRESNRAAIAFYELLGFERAGTRPGYYSNPPESALVLRTRLSQS
jgi:[ribosomal protein S18]-alanine N-acetyltransferase